MDVSAARERQGEAPATRPGLSHTPKIRRAREDELGEIAALFPPALAPYRGTSADAALDGYLHELVDGVRSRWEGGECYVAVTAGRIVGSVVFYDDVTLEGWSNLPAGWAGFRALVVDPEARGAGIGRGLVERCLARARETGARVVGIHSAEVLSDAVRLYERLGFVRCPEYDLSAAVAFPVDTADDVAAIAFRYDLS
ncbi:MAG TPA: GNAT family N-acetyltransferase [Gaiella sp.]|jgi:GNAT superfamily N-acetyltransferase|nr:GNAT family N-acetyltransferase [Gaiella sp.]